MRAQLVDKDKSRAALYACDWQFITVLRDPRDPIVPHWETEIDNFH
jgi:hypothetical protein